MGARPLDMAVITGFVPLIALGVIVPILAKVMTWYGLQPQKHADAKSPTLFFVKSGVFEFYLISGITFLF